MMQENIQDIVLCKLENWIEAERFPGEAAEGCSAIQNNSGTIVTETPQNAAKIVIYSEPCERLFALQEQGYCTLAELKHLQGVTEEEAAEAICREETVRQFKNICINALELPQGYLRRIWCKSQNIPVLIAETGRLLIRESTEEDAEAFCELYRDADSKKYLEPLPVENGNSVLPIESNTGNDALLSVPEEADQNTAANDRAQEIEKYKRYIKEYAEGQYAFYEYGMWTVIEKKSGAAVGRMGLEQQEGDVNLGYALLPEFRGQGYAIEACLAILNYCRECGYAEQVAIRIDRDNQKSRRVAERLQTTLGNMIELKELSV